MASWQVRIVSMLALAAVPTGAVGQRHCRPPDSTGMVFLAHIARHAGADSGTDVAVRDSLRLQYTPREQVALSQDAELCRQAALAYRRELTTAAETHTGRVYVVQAGERFAVLDLDYHIAPRRPRWVIAIFDREWRRLSLF